MSASGFNPRAREGRDARGQPSALTGAVSIHAPVKGATADGGRDQRDGAVSIHAPVKGATAWMSWTCWTGWFQSTRP